MRPIKLKIRGLNSFNEEQTIDFEKLTSQGLFGIFGPTGSGKSTVLDGITLALYGDVSRKSTNFINTNCDSLAVSFTFQISGSEKKQYVVEREFKRDKKTGGTTSGKCKIVDITEEEPLVLADKVKEVTNTCREIIGLSLEDFTRTVVLPQGKFSEFLKLEGKTRRDMLERLFNLQQYGDDLTLKLKKEKNIEEAKNSELLGELRGYEGINEEALREKNNQIKETSAALALAKEELKTIEKDYKEKEELWNLSVEVQGLKNKKQEMEIKKTDFESIKGNIIKGESAAKIMPYVTAYNNTLKELKNINGDIDELGKKYLLLKEKKEELDKGWNQWRSKKDEEIPKLMVKKQQFTEALEEEKNVKNLEIEINELKKVVTSLIGDEEKFIKEVIQLEDRIEKGIKVTKDTEEILEKLQIDSEFKEAVQKGLIIYEKYKDLSNIIKNKKIKLEDLKEEDKVSTETLHILNSKLKIKQEDLKKIIEEKEKLQNKVPGTQEDLLRLQRKVSDGSEAWKKYNQELKSIKDNEEELVAIEKAIKSKEEEREKISREISDLKQRIKALQIENIAHNLREALEEGEPCPVCGSRNHHKEDIEKVDSRELATLERAQLEKEGTLKEIEKCITTKEARLKTLGDSIEESNKEISFLGEEFKEKTVKELEDEVKALSEAITVYNKNKEKTEELYLKVKEEIMAYEGKINTTKSINEGQKNQLMVLRSELEKDLLDFEKLQTEIEEITSSTGIKDFEQENKEILVKEKEKAENEKKLKTCRTLMEELQDKRAIIQNQVNKVKESLAGERGTLEEKTRAFEDKRAALYKKVGVDVNIQEQLNTLNKTIENIEESYEKINKEKDEADKEFTLCNEGLIGQRAKERELEKRRGKEEEALKKLLTEEGFSSSEEVIKYFLPKEEIKNMKIQLEEYENSFARLLGAIESINDKIKGRYISKLQWQECEESKSKKEEVVNNLKEEEIKLKNEGLLIKRKIEELGELLKKKEKLEHKLALLEDLEKLFKGKRFVEFVAANRLKYISLEASKKLKEISSGTYGLEVDENGKFIIRDYKNGGAARDASTLSGGETFLTSLALALALSSEIQLKGTAPLELFFLDEGFGTLDDNLLEIVMSSLERLHNEKLKIGIISHVESIKNRVPVKLVITPAEAGKGGSKVAIEKS